MALENKTKNTEIKSWYALLLNLADRAVSDGHNELARELENVAVNYSPEALEG